MKISEFVAITLILIGGFIVRLYNFDSPVADWHSWRQSDTSAVSRNFVKDGFDLLRPYFDDLSNVASGTDNPMGYRFVEFPIYNVLQAGTFLLFDVFTLEQWGRLVNIFASLASTVFLFLLISKYVNKTTGFLTAFFFTFLPFNIYYSRTILPDISMTTAILGGTYFFDLWLDSYTQNKSAHIKSWIYFFVAVVLTSFAFLLKPFALFFTLPMVYLGFKKFSFNIYKKWQLWVFAFLCLTPLVLWRLWMQQYPEGIPQSDWLFNGGNIRFKGAFFYWIFADRLGRLILGFWGIGLLLLGITRNYADKSKFFIFSFLVSAILYIFTIARGNVQHDYYQILIIPAVAIFLGSGAQFLLDPPREYFNKIIGNVSLLVIIIFSFSFSWYFVREYYNINNLSIVAAGKAVDALLPKDAKVIAPYEGDTSFLYQTKRKGWASFEKPLAEMIELGADYLVLTNPVQKDYEGIGSQFKIVADSIQYVIFDLKQKP